MSSVVEELIREAADCFDRAGIPEAEREARRVADVLLPGVSTLDPDQPPPAFTTRFIELVRQRERRVPLDRLLGHVRFRALELAIGEGTFAPQPETSAVVDWCVAALDRAGLRSPRVVDLCTGPGTVALALANEVPGAEVHAVEISPAAFAWAQRNAETRQAAGDRPVRLHLADAATALRSLDGTFDLVVSNPPYVADHELSQLQPEVREYDPRLAVRGGPDGLDLVRIVERAAARLCRDGGLLAVEPSDRQGSSAPSVLTATAAWTEVEDHRDGDGRDRFVTARRAERG